MFRPSFLLIATGDYKKWIPQCVKSIQKYFPKSFIYLFGDEQPEDWQQEKFFKIAHQKWPYVTLYRFNYFLQAQDHLIGEYFYFIDIDAKFVRKPEIQGDLVAVRHCAYFFDQDNQQKFNIKKPDELRLPQEINTKSIFYNYKFNKYYGGGFFGGFREEFFKLCKWCDEGINKDVDHGVIPIHNDETAMNAYFTLYPPTLELNPSYHYPENDDYFSKRCWGGHKPFKPVIFLHDKFKEKGEKIYRLQT